MTNTRGISACVCLFVYSTLMGVYLLRRVPEQTLNNANFKDFFRNSKTHRTVVMTVLIHRETRNIITIFNDG